MSKRTRKCPLTPEEQAIAIGEVARIKEERKDAEVYRALHSYINRYDRLNPEHADYGLRTVSRSEIKGLARVEVYNRAERFDAALGKVATAIRDDLDKEARALWTALVLLFLGSAASIITLGVKVAG